MVFDSALQYLHPQSWMHLVNSICPSKARQCHFFCEAFPDLTKECSFHFFVFCTSAATFCDLSYCRISVHFFDYITAELLAPQQHIFFFTCRLQTQWLEHYTCQVKYCAKMNVIVHRKYNDKGKIMRACFRIQFFF